MPLRYLAGSYLARLAEEGVAVAVALLAVQRTGDVGVAAVLMAAWLMPHIVAAPLVGAMAARFVHPVRFYATALIVFAVAVSGLTAAVGNIPLWVNVVVASVGGACGPVVAGGLSSLVAELVREDGRDRGYALDAAVYNAAAVTGPAVAAGVAVVFPAQAAGYLLAVSAALGGVLIAGLPAESKSPSGGPLLSALSVGFTAMWRRRVLRAVTVATGVAYLGVGGLTLVAVTMADRWDDPTLGGALATCFAAGAVTGALVVARLRPPWSAERLAMVSLAVTGIGLLLAAWTPWFWFTAVMFVMAGFGDGPLLSATFQVRAAHTTREDRAQVFTTGAAVKISAAALGAALVGSVPVSAGIFLTWIAVLQFGAAGLLWLMMPRWSRRGIAADPAFAQGAPDAGCET